VTPTSELEIDFASGRKLKVEPDRSGGAESWELTGPGFFVVGTAGGPAIWTGDAWRVD
jgi:Family of unknown function (DUF6188)